MVKRVSIALVLWVSLVSAPAAVLACDCRTRAACTGTELDSQCGYSTRRPGGPWAYDTEYLFVTSRMLHDTCNEPAACAPLIPLAVVIDLAMLPFAAGFGLIGE